MRTSTQLLRHGSHSSVLVIYGAPVQGALNVPCGSHGPFARAYPVLSHRVRPSSPARVPATPRSSCLVAPPMPGPRACRNRELFLDRRAVSPNLTRTSAIPSGRLTESIDRMPPGRPPKKAYRNTDTTAATEARRKRKEPDEDTPRRTIIPTRPRCARLPEPISPSFSIASTAVGTPLWSMPYHHICSRTQASCTFLSPPLVAKS